MERVVVERLDHQGRGIAKLNNVVTFISNALVDEIVEIKLTKQKKKYNEAEVVNFIKKSPNRIEPICPYFLLCGGCSIMHMKNKIEYKNDVVKDIFQKYIKTNIKINDIRSFNDLYYRNKITLKVNDNKIGYYKKATNELVEIDNCLIASKKINEILKELKNHLDTSSISNIVIKASEKENDSMVIIDNIANKESIKEKLGEYSFLISKDAFFQTNTLVAEKLYDEVIRLANFNKNDQVLDLYCGTGTISIYISKFVKKVIGVEIVKSAIESANKNKELNNINNVSFICGDVKDVLAKEKFNPNIIIVDPPRKGLDKKVISELLEINPTKIVYVSCNLLTLVRDLNLLMDNYNILEVSPFDMFPNTYHVESVVVLERKS